MNHPETSLQCSCVAWFRLQYPEYSRLLFHVKNEEKGGRVSGAIYKGAGVVPGVPDLILSIPATSKDKTLHFNSLGIELKSGKNKQNENQKIFQRFFEASGSVYIVVRSLDDFIAVITTYMMCALNLDSIKEAYNETERLQASSNLKYFHRFLKYI